MDFSFSDEQQDLAALARKILGDRVSHDGLTALEAAGGERFDPSLWAELAAADLLGIALPADLGGSGYGVVEQCLVLQEVGRELAPVPVLASIVLGAMPVAEFGTAGQRQALVPPAAEGRLLLTAALSEPRNRHATRPATTAVRDGDGWRLDGVKTAVPAGMLAERVLVPASTDAGVQVFLVDPAAPGVARSAQRTTNKETYALLELDGVRLSDDDLLGGGERSGAEIVAWTLERATVGLCAMQLGVTEAALEATAEYTKNRYQFERPIATFQAVGHRCADAYIDVEGIRLTLLQAAWRLSVGLPATQEVETAKFWASDGGHRVAHAVVHLHGGMGVASDYFVHRYFIHAKQIELTLGGATEQAMRIGAALAAEPA